MKHKLEYARSKNDKIIASFRHTFMSNSKWVKLIDALSKNSILFHNIKVKLVWDNAIRRLFIDHNTTYNFDYYHDSMEAMISGYPSGFYQYKEIEWIECEINAGQLPVMTRMLNDVGQFKMTKDALSLKIFGYQ